MNKSFHSGLRPGILPVVKIGFWWGRPRKIFKGVSLPKSGDYLKNLTLIFFND